MTTQEYQTWAKQFADNYLTSDLYENHLAKQRQEEKEGVRIWKSK